MFFKNFIKFYLPTLLWLGMIFYLSSLPDLRYRTGSISSELFLRKGAHLLEYIFLAFLFWRIFFGLHRLEEKKAFLFSFLLLFFFALSDEWHQSLIVGRSGKIIDAIYDGLSGLLFLQGAFFWRKKTQKRAVVFLFVLAGLVFLEGWIIKTANQFQEKNQKAEIQKEQKSSPEISSEVTLREEKKEEVAPEKTVLPTKNAIIEPTESEKKVLPEKMFVSVPFTSQAPFGVWDEYHEEACEEAALLMVAYHLKGKTLDRDTAEKELQALIAFQLKNYGEYKDSDVAQTIKLGKDFYGLNNLKAVYDFSLAELKEYLAQGKPIIIPTAGRLLKNPNFTSPGPLYHNLVLVGWEKGAIITNDPGTRRGEGYRYEEKLLYSAIHDFTGEKEKIETGRKAMIVIE